MFNICIFYKLAHYSINVFLLFIFFFQQMGTQFSVQFMYYLLDTMIALFYGIA